MKKQSNDELKAAAKHFYDTAEKGFWTFKTTSGMAICNVDGCFANQAIGQDCYAAFVKLMDVIKNLK